MALLLGAPPGQERGSSAGKRCVVRPTPCCQRRGDAASHQGARRLRCINYGVGGAQCSLQATRVPLSVSCAPWAELQQQTHRGISFA
eukprot:4793164-Alexandrium_andersonii.AAC.1